MNRLGNAGLSIFTGRFGSGKTETALNYAVLLAQGSKLHSWGAKVVAGNQRPESWSPASDLQRPAFSVPVPSCNIQMSGSNLQAPILIDLDIVTPFFRSRDMREVLLQRGVEVIAPSPIGQHLDTPAITPQILGAIQQPRRPVVLDVGGDRQGARALGQFGPAIRQRSYVMHFVVNPYRPFTDTLPGLARSITEIEVSARLKVHYLVSNPNLIGETTARTIVEGHARIETFARELGLPIAFVCVEQQWAAQLSTGHAGQRPFTQPVLPLKRNFVLEWE